MREFERYAKEPSQQLEIPGLGSKGEQNMREAREWIAANPAAYEHLLFKIRWEKQSGKLSIRDLIGWLRIETHVSVKNSITPALARIIEAEEPGLAGVFTKSKSSCDGFAA